MPTHAACARGCTALASVASTIAWGAALFIACDTCSCSALGAGTAWELVTSQPLEKQPAIRPASDTEKAETQESAAPRSAQPPDRPSLTVPQSADARWTTLSKLDRSVSVEWKDVPLVEAFELFRVQAGVDMMVMWIDEDNPSIGLRRDRTISLIAQHQGLIDVLEKILERADTRAKGGGSTWQISDTGTLQVGPRERLNKWTRTYAYDMADLFMASHDMFDPDDALLQHGIQTPQSVNTSTSLMHRRYNAGMHDERPYPVRAEELRQIIMQTCEPSAWIDNGGDAASILLHTTSKTFVVRAPDYVHRAIDGYHPTLPGRTRVYEHDAGPLRTPTPQQAPAATLPTK